MSEQTGGAVLHANGTADETQPASAVASPDPQGGDLGSAADKVSKQAAGGSTLGEEGCVAVDSVTGTTIEATPDPTVVDPTRPSDEQILTYENELRCACGNLVCLSSRFSPIHDHSKVYRIVMQSGTVEAAPSSRGEGPNRVPAPRVCGQ